MANEMIYHLSFPFCRSFVAQHAPPLCLPFRLSICSLWLSLSLSLSLSLFPSPSFPPSFFPCLRFIVCKVVMHLHDDVRSADADAMRRGIRPVISVSLCASEDQFSLCADTSALHCGWCKGRTQWNCLDSPLFVHQFQNLIKFQSDNWS